MKPGQGSQTAVLVCMGRAVEIDEALRAAGAPQVVLLGAGLDGRAWRMPELSGAVVFEVDHPDSQRDKRGRVAELVLAAREVRFVTTQTREATGQDPPSPARPD